MMKKSKKRRFHIVKCVLTFSDFSAHHVTGHVRMLFPPPQRIVLGHLCLGRGGKISSRKNGGEALGFFSLMRPWVMNLNLRRGDLG